jgi:hypothetical protein
MAAADQGYLENLAKALAGVVDKNLKTMIADGYRDQPQLKKRAIIEYEGRLRASGMDVFNSATYISYVCYYLSEKAKATHAAAGTLLLYLKKSQADVILKMVGYRGVDLEDEEGMMKTCGEFCNLLAQDFQKELVAKAFPQLIVTAPENFLNSVPIGIDFSKDQFDQYEIGFSFKGERCLVFELSFASLGSGK